MWYVLLARGWKKLGGKTEAAIRDCLDSCPDIRELRKRELIFPCRHDVLGSHDVITFTNQIKGWRRTVRPNGEVVLWRKIEWSCEDGEEESANRTWVWAKDDAADSAAGEEASGVSAPLSVSSETCHYEQASKLQ